jgi:hypothetical protein
MVFIKYFYLYMKIDWKINFLKKTLPLYFFFFLPRNALFVSLLKKNKGHTKCHPHLLKHVVELGLVNPTKFILNSRSFRFGPKPRTDGKFIEWVSPCWIVVAFKKRIKELAHLKLHSINLVCLLIFGFSISSILLLRKSAFQSCFELLRRFFSLRYCRIENISTTNYRIYSKMVLVILKLWVKWILCLW